MLNYRILASTGTTSIVIPLSMDNNPMNHDDDDDLASNAAIAAVNPIIDNEQEGYSPASNYKIQFNFISNGIYYDTWQAAGFVMPDDIQKNVFKKSMFLVEFYDSNLSTNNLLFNTTVSIYPNEATAKGADSSGTGTGMTVYTTFTVDEVRNELYLLFYNRDFSSLSNVQTDSTGTYVSLYMKVMFLNAKTGNVQYFFQSSNFIPLTTTAFVPSVYYNEVRFYNNLTYAFYNNGVLLTSINYNEIYVNQ